MNDRTATPLPGRHRTQHCRRARRSWRWPLLGACIWMFLMTMLGADWAGGEAADDVAEVPRCVSSSPQR